MIPIIAILISFLLGAQANAKSPKLAADLNGANRAATIPVIVQYMHSPAHSDTQRIIREGGSVLRRFDHTNSMALRIPVSALESLAADPNVVYVSPDRRVHAKLDYTTTAVNASAAWQSSWLGTGIGVAVIDSGVSPHPDLTGSKNRIVYTQDFVYTDGADQYGHGEHVAGIIAADGDSSHCSDCTRNLSGVAPDSNIINLRVLDENGNGTDSAVIAAIDQAISLKDQYNIRVINLSLGRPVFESYTLDPLCQAVEAAWKAGIVVVVAAGNDGRDDSMGTNGYGTITVPGNDPYVITVGAMKTMQTFDRSDDLVASYSSKGPTLIDHIVKPDIVAPGNKVVSLQASGSTLTQYAQNAVPISYYESGSSVVDTVSSIYLSLNGTSMATPVVSGAVADLLEAEPNLTPDQVKARLMKTASKTFPQTSVATDPATGQTFVSQYDIFTIGAGYLDIAAALSSTDVAAGSAVSPSALFDPTSNNIYLSPDPSSAWSDSTTSGAQGVWGVQSVWGTAVVGASQGVWGVQGVWGTNGVWGTSDLSGAKSVWSADTLVTSSNSGASQGVWGVRGVWGTSNGVEGASLDVIVNGEE